MLNGHALERILKFRAAVTADLVGLSLHRKHPAESNVMTSKEEIKDISKDRHKLAFNFRHQVLIGSQSTLRLN